MNTLKKKLDAYHQHATTHPITGKPLVYNPIDVLNCSAVLKQQSLSDLDRFRILEQLFKASLDTLDFKLAKEYLDVIIKRFPTDEFGRSCLLYGLYHEAKKEWSSAHQYYQLALEKDECNMQARKKKIGLLKAQGKITEAIQAYVEYVDSFMQDIDAWNELSLLYLQESMLDQAAFCVEEMILLKPNYPNYYIRFADIQFSLKNYEFAIKYYCFTLEICEDHLRGLYGLHSSCKLLLEQLKESKDLQLNMIAQDHLEDLYELSKVRLKHVYSDNQNQIKDKSLTRIFNQWSSKYF